MTSFVRLSNFDNVVTATKTLQANETIEGIKTLQSVPTGHKIASVTLKKVIRLRNMHSVLVMHPLTLQPVSMFTHIMLSLEIPKQIMNFRQKKNQ